MDGSEERPSEPTLVGTSLEGRVWRVTLQRPGGNAIDVALAEQLGAAFDRRPAAARAILLDAEGPHFCVGGDVRGFAASEDPGAFVGRLAEEWHRVIRAVVHSQVPVVAAVRGAVAGAGMGLVAACDLSVCAASTRLHPAYLSLGLSPDGGTSWALVRALGRARAVDVMLTNGSLTAGEALSAGLVSRVTDDDQVARLAEELAHQLARGPIRAMARTRHLARDAAVLDLDQHLDAEARLIAESADDVEGREGVRAFVERRPADFLGGSSAPH
jgi:2-(1,2-epoxy-1,2-dihydrophenyl)acetyl-CoA isomerase